MKDIKYATIVPLVGGMTIGNNMATGKWPEFLLSYEAFNENDSNLVNYLNEDKKLNIPYYQLDSKDFSDKDLNEIKNSEIDFVSAVCPCAGLSLLNRSNRGSDAPQNEWLYTSAKFVLENVKPKVFWGENAPGLISKIGEGVREKLWNIAKEFGYSFSIVKTSTTKHGIPQRRVRTFYFFWKSETAPIMNYYSRETPKLADYLSTIPEGLKHEEIDDKLEENIFFKWFNENYSREDLFKGEDDNSTIIKFLGRDEEKLKSFEKYIIENGTERDMKKLNHMKNKYGMGLGVWDDSPHFYTANMNAVISKNQRSAVHPTQDRYLSHREMMYLMGLPHDFNLTSKKMTIYTQNVPTFTARDWTHEVVKFINGELKSSNSKYLVQDNLNTEETEIVPLQEFETKELF